MGLSPPWKKAFDLTVLLKNLFSLTFKKFFLMTSEVFIHERTVICNGIRNVALFNAY